MDLPFLWETFQRLLGGLPLTLQLASVSLAFGAALALGLALLIVYGPWPLALPARAFVFAFRGTPLLVQLFLIYYGLSQFPEVRASFAWPFLRQPWGCAVLALTLNTAAYGAEILRGGLLAVPKGQAEAARACGMSGLLLFRRLTLPVALRQALPAYGNEIVLMVRATAVASIVTLMEVTGIAQKIIAETFRSLEVFVCAGALYLVVNAVLTRAIAALESRLNPDRRAPQDPLPIAAAPGTA